MYGHTKCGECPYNGMPFSNDVNGALIHAMTWMNLENNGNFKKPLTKDQVLYDSTYVKCPEQTNPQTQKEN